MYRGAFETGLRACLRIWQNAVGPQPNHDHEPSFKLANKTAPISVFMPTPLGAVSPVTKVNQKQSTSASVNCAKSPSFNLPSQPVSPGMSGFDDTSTCHATAE